MAAIPLPIAYHIGMPDIIDFASIQPDHSAEVGGKGLSLGLTAAAGLPVPPGFCVTATAYRRHSQTLRVDDPLRTAIDHAYRQLGGGLVAVRSSATAEDGAATSFAGQQETILGVSGLDEVIRAVERCWASLHTDRARAYRLKQGIADAGLSMSVVVQRLVNADVAGVMFTRDPLDASGQLARIEASWGLGEAVVSGRVTPDRYQIERNTGKVRDQQVGRKTIQIGANGEVPVAPDQQNVLCLSEANLKSLAELGQRVEEFYRDPRDIEWAIANGVVYLLQARPITTVGAAEREQSRTTLIARLKSQAVPGGTVWARTNLIEVLPEPTPMTWALVSERLLSGGGATGRMYRDFGFNPAPEMTHLSAYDLIGGRPFLNLAREPRLESAKPLSTYPLAKYRQQPSLALDPKRDDPRGLRKWFGLLGMLKVASKISSASKSFASEFRERILPPYLEAVKKANDENLTRLEPNALVNRIETWANRSLVELAQHSLKPTLLAQFAWQVLEQQLTKSLGRDRARAALTELSQGAHADPDADLPTAIRSLASGRLTRERFLEQFGHRGPNEMELSSPRWRESPGSLAKLAYAPDAKKIDPKEVFERIAAEAKWPGFLAKTMQGHVDRLQTYLGLRETGKHYLMAGFFEVRRTLLELDRRFALDGGVFYLLPGELPDLVQGTNLVSRAVERRKQRSMELSLEVPAVLFDDDLEAIGRPLPVPAGASEWSGVPLSAGVAEGPALVLHEPTDETPEPGYVLVCPSTDPAWVPLFVHARALVMESGGTLSHGAIVAREFGLPAVAGLPGVQHQVKTGQKLRVDGGRGTVVVIGE